MSGISSLGAGVGIIYAVRPDGVTVEQNIPNDGPGERKAKSLANQSYSEASNRSATGEVTFTASSAGESVTAVTINGVNQIGASVSTSATTDQTALDVANAINAYTPPSGPDYTAEVFGSVITIFSTPESGSTVNGLAITVSVTNVVAITFTTINIDGGASSSSLYDEATGYRFFLNPSPSAPFGNVTGAVEITEFIIPQTFTQSLYRVEPTISGGNIDLPRKSNLTYMVVDTEGAAATDDLETIESDGYAIGDRIILRGTDPARVVTVKDGVGNISLRSGDFLTGTLSYSLVLQLDIQGVGTQQWYEVTRSSESIGTTTDYRSAGYPFGVEGESTIAAPTTAGSTSLVAGVDEVYQIVTGSGTRTGNYNIQFDNTGAIAGDKFLVEYNGSFTASGFNFFIGDIPLTDIQMLTGGWIVEGYYDGSSWNSYIYPNMKSTGSIPEIETIHIHDDAVTAPKVEPNLRQEGMAFLLSFDTGETGDYKVVMPYPGTIKKVEAYVTKNIEGSDDAQICIKDNALVTMATIDLLAGATNGTGNNALPTTNNTFVKDDIITFNTAKVTAGGKCIVSVEIERS